MFDLSGRVALVTGAGQHVGAGIAAALAQQGAAVAVNDLVPERAAAVAADLERRGARAGAAPFDVTDAAAGDAGVAAVVARLGPVAVLVNNAGVPADMALTPFRALPPERWAAAVDLNLYGSLRCARAVLDGMCERGWGRIVQISSGAGRSGLPIGIAVYGAAKSAVEGFARHLSQEVARDGATVNVLALGGMETAAQGDDGVVAMLARGVPVGRLGTAADVGAAVVYLASDEASWLTGQTIDLNGGATQH